MTETEKAYIARIIDAKGNITLQRFHSNEYPSPCISIASTTLELLIWIKNIVGHGVINNKKYFNFQNHKDCYIYKIKYDDAINLLEKIYPYLIKDNKKQRADLILNKYKYLNPHGHYSSKLIKSRLEFYDEFLNLEKN